MFYNVENRSEKKLNRQNGGQTKLGDARNNEQIKRGVAQAEKSWVNDKKTVVFMLHFASDGIYQAESIKRERDVGAFEEVGRQFIMPVSKF